ncbi:MAG: hypothetical protein IPL42_03000 [Saprospiraceae bacterium]|nr:hypothetical protein [Saprospiraceae bacterium]
MQILKIGFIILLILHGLIHLMGFVKAFHIVTVNPLSQSISKFNGVLWLLTGFVFLFSAILLILHQDTWWIPLLVTIALSQYLLFSSWQDAKYGSIVNIILVLVCLLGYFSWSFQGKYKEEVRFRLTQTQSANETILLESDIQNLPKIVQKYLLHAGVLGQPKVRNFKIKFRGQIRKNEQSKWMQFTSEQYNFLDASTRLFFMKASMNGLPVTGFHSFKGGDAFMDIRLFSIFKVQYQSGAEMGIAETVTFFNDMCCMAPATLIDNKIHWLQEDSLKVKARFTNQGISIEAWLYFNKDGALVNFISNDRFATTESNTMERIPWATPLKDYQLINGRMLATNADAVYSYPSGDFCYGQFQLIQVEYNCTL